ncbi:hypothetical protein PHJA_002903400 [Phtheirospermum japonicum]|uniref:Uncharacterized protein n=1 Tax=Phtheirospermum japonicum TaxID=374723 RepID=A0A830DA32_9LAMI|nr:hypothetical protein PHJA_002903400 [Phtheirospermum japonicum]
MRPTLPPLLGSSPSHHCLAHNPETWHELIIIRKAKEGGLNVIETYVFSSSGQFKTALAFLHILRDVDEEEDPELVSSVDENLRDFELIFPVSNHESV